MIKETVIFFPESREGDYTSLLRLMMMMQRNYAISVKSLNTFTHVARNKNSFDEQLITLETDRALMIIGFKMQPNAL